jgi:pyrimidine-nucleoside phosphorylase
MIEFQGGNPRVVADPSLLPQPRQRIPALSLRGGYVRSISTEKMGFLSIDIGCGRRRREDEIDPAAGFLVEKNVGDRVEPGETLAWLCLGKREPPRPNMERELAALFHVGDEKVEAPSLAIEKL